MNSWISPKDPEVFIWRRGRRLHPMGWWEDTIDIPCVLVCDRDCSVDPASERADRSGKPGSHSDETSPINNT